MWVFVAPSCGGGRRRVLVILVIAVCLLHLILQHHVLQRFLVFRRPGGVSGKESAVTLNNLKPSNGDSEAKDDRHRDLGNDTVIPLKWPPQVRWPLMVFSTVGRLGNCLNTYAFALALRDAYPATVAVTLPIVKRLRAVLASENLTLPVIDMKFEEAADEEEAVEVVQPDYLKNDMVSHLEPTFQRAVREFRQGGGRKVFMLPGYPNRMWMLAQNLSTIRASYRIRAELQQEARRFLDRARQGKGRNVTFVGLHIRRGDYVNFLKNFHNCSLPGPEFYAVAMNHYRASLTDPLFVVTSDDLHHARHHLHHNPDVVFSDLRTAEGDMALLAACSHSIMTVGSFGFWSSFLAGGHVVYPLINGCSKTPFMHPDNLRSRGFENWLPLLVESHDSEVK